MKKKRNVKSILKDVLIVILILVCIAEGVLLKAFAFNSGDGIASRYKLEQIRKAIDKYYLYDADNDQLEEYTYKGLVAGLQEDYSCYYTAEEYKALQEDTDGVFSGIGAVLQQDKDGYISIVRTIDGSPAQEAGLKAGDILTKVDGEDISLDDDLSEVVTRIKGDEGTTVEISFSRDGKEKDYKIKRKQIESPTVDYEMLDNKVGYIQITQFDDVTVDQFKEALTDLQNQGMKSMVLDLRDNPGGLLTAVVDIADMILPTGMIVYTKDKNGDKEEYKATTEDELGVPLAVLINGNSASASEILAGAIQDYDYGTLVGTTSFGKGIVQNIMGLGDGSAIKLTVANYYTPKGRNIHKKGITPDVEVELDEDLQSKTTIKKSEDNQLQKAIEELKKKK